MKPGTRRSIGPALTRVLALTAAMLGPAVVLEAMRVAFIDPLPFHDPQNLVSITGVSQPHGRDYIDLFAEARTLQAATCLRYGRVTWSRPGGSRRVDVLEGDHMTLSVLGLTPLQGRHFSRADLKSPRTALVSRKFLEEELGGGPSGLERALQLNGSVYQVVGVAPDSLARLGAFDVLLPRIEGRSYGLPMGESPSFLSNLTLARKVSRVSMIEVQQEMARLQRTQEGPGLGHSMVGVRGLQMVLTNPALPTLATLSFAALVLLLLSAVTIGMLAALLAAERVQEFAIRTALGATVSRLRVEAVRPWLQAMVPAIATSVLLSTVLSRFIRSALPSLGEIPSFSTKAVLLTVAIGLVLTTVAFVCTLIPQQLALHLGFAHGALSAAHRGAALGRLLGMAQVALSVALFCGAAVATRGLIDQSQRDLGIVSGGVQVIEMDLGEGRKPEALRADWNRLVAAVGDREANLSFGSTLPWAPTSSWWMTNPTDGLGTMVGVTRVGAGFFSTLGIQFREGADPFSSGNETNDVVVSEEVARLLRVRTGAVVKVNDDLRRVAGVVNVVYDPTRGPGSVWPQMYLMANTGTRSEASASVFLRGSAREALAVRARIEATLPHASISPPSPLAGLLSSRLQRQRLGTQVLAGYAITAALLVIFGLSALMRRRVAQRMSEVGVRLVLGASRSQIDKAMLSAVTAPALLGTVLGVLLGFRLSETVASVMPWAKPLDPSVYALSALGGLLVVLISAWPALRLASRARPADLLRHTT